MQAEVRTRTVVRRGGRVEMVMEILLLPRGSGNRYKARRLAQAFKEHRIMGPHIHKVVCGTSKVALHMEPSLDLLGAIAETVEEGRRREGEADQMPLFPETGLAGG